MNEHIVKLNNDKSAAEYIAAQKYLFYIPGGAQSNQSWFSDCGNWSLWLKYKSAITPLKATSHENRDSSPLSNMDEPIPTSLPLAAVEAMLGEMETVGLITINNSPRRKLNRQTMSINPNYQPDDWVIAGLNCTKDEDILPICIHSYLMDWRPE